MLFERTTNACKLVYNEDVNIFHIVPSFAFHLLLPILVFPSISPSALHVRLIFLNAEAFDVPEEATVAACENDGRLHQANYVIQLTHYIQSVANQVITKGVKMFFFHPTAGRNGAVCFMCVFS